MTNLEALRLLNAEGMAEFITSERMLVLKLISGDEEVKTDLKAIGYEFDVDRMERDFKQNVLNWLIKECPYI